MGYVRQVVHQGAAGAVECGAICGPAATRTHMSLEHVEAEAEVRPRASLSLSLSGPQQKNKTKHAGPALHIITGTPYLTIL